MSKQDRQGVRTPAALEQKYNFGKSFAEVMGIATDAQKAVAEMEREFDEALTSEQVFNILTNNGELQGLYRGDDGELYVNAEYILSGILKGTYTNTAEVFLEPGIEEMNTMRDHIFAQANGEVVIPADKIPLYDFNGDGSITISDIIKASNAYYGRASLAEWSGAVKSTVTITIDMSKPNRFLSITGTNMWGREIDICISAYDHLSYFVSRAYLDTMLKCDVDTSGNGTIMYRVVSGENEYLNPPMQLGVEYRTTERYDGYPVYRKRISYSYDGSSSGDLNIPHEISDFWNLVRCTAKNGTYPLPRSSTYIHSVTADNVVLHIGDSWSASTFEFDLAYTKL